ncbi:type 2 periplasmic-binding domain-containing protein [Devriesea agamarum]|uniref:extracellular solute-binding protein n=1 Tax=Devriesea agamarum TaxID=472569 RepID=UPI00071CF3BB|nr:extracellular solute-binding protein [Devriesea agamarum]
MDATSLPTPHLSRRNLFAAAGASAATVALASCGGDDVSQPKRDATEFVPPKTIEPKPVEGLITSDVAGVAPMMIGSPRTYYKAVSEPPAKGGTLSTFQILWGAPVPERSKNKVWQELEKQLGVNELKATMVPYASFNDKLATTLASGDLPDMIYLDDTNANAARAISDGAFVALNQYLEGDLIKKYPNLATTPQEAWVNSHKNGTIYGIPQPAAAIDWFPVIRKDAMKQIGMNDVPHNGHELRDMLVEFAKLGTLGGRQVWAVGGVDPSIFEPIHKIGPTFQVKDGKVITKFDLPEYEEHLKYVADLWTNKVFHPDALGHVDPELFAQGQQLFYSASFAGYYWLPDQGRINLVKRAVPSAEVVHFVIPALDGGPGTFVRNKGYGAIVGFSRDKAKSKDRIEELLRIANYYRSPFGSEEAKFLQYGIEGRQYKVGPHNEIEPIENAPAEGHITYSGLLQNPVNSLPVINKDLSDNVRSTIEGMVKASEPDKLGRILNEQLTKNKTRLDEIQKDFFNGMISGRRPLTDIKKFRETYRSSGGQAVIDEYQKQLDKAGK